MEVLRSQLSKVRVPLPDAKIYKDECIFSFDTPESENGLFVCMNTFLGFGRQHVEQHYRRTGNSVFLHFKTIKKELSVERGKEDKPNPTRLAIGLEGGFNVDDEKKYKLEERNSIIILPDFVTIPLPNVDLPDIVLLSIASIFSAQSANNLAEASASTGTWDGEIRKIYKKAKTLNQLNNGVKIPPYGWKCKDCDKTNNLWLNLTDGAILCGRKFFDGSGGNNHAMEHYQKMGYPLVVKLGTITPTGGDCYAYDEDDMVEDPHLNEHLAHFGINISQMEKTDKSMVELEIDMNKRVGEWAILQEADSQLVPAYGPGYTGLANLGNSCYLNSVMQVIFNIPDFQHKYFGEAQNIFNTAPANPAEDFNVQMAKLASGLLSGDYSQPPKDPNMGQEGIKPAMLKNLIGKGHPEFSTKKQQDAQEFFLYLISLLERHNRGSVNPAECFKYEVEERLQCAESKKVKYTTRTDYLLPLHIPLHAATNKNEMIAYQLKKEDLEAKGEKIPEIVRARIPMQKCLDDFVGSDIVEDFFSSALNRRTVAEKTTKLKTFPDFLMVQFRKYQIGPDFVSKKLDVAVDIPDTLDLSLLRAKGIQPGEEELPETRPAASTFDPDPITLAQLVEMGFPLESCKRALYITRNTGIEAAMNWIVENMSHPDFGSPFEVPASGETKNSFVPDPEHVNTIMAMGFSSQEARKALSSTDNNLERSVDWIFSHADELQSLPMETDQAEQPPNQGGCRDGSERYQLMAFISHMGSSTLVGHYVCHILKEGRWVIFNDNKVAFSENPPKELAYLYLYQRI